jgi:hypothetical protein
MRRSTIYCGHMEACQRGISSRRSRIRRWNQYDAEQSGEREPPITRVLKSKSLGGGPVTAVVTQTEATTNTVR